MSSKISPKELRGRLGSGAAVAWKRTTASGKRAIKQLYLRPGGAVPMACGRSGYQIAYPDGRKVRLRGAANVLGTVAWRGRMLTQATSAEKRVAGGSGPVQLSNGKTYFGSASGLERGKDVHQEMHDYIVLPSKRFAAKYPVVDPMTRNVLLALSRRKLMGVAAEYIVHDSGSRCGTAVDAVCLDTRGTVVLVELKTGYGRRFGRPPAKAGSMVGEFSDIPDSPLNRAKLQLVYGMELLWRTHRVRAKGIVVHVTRIGEVAIYDIGREFATRYGPKIFSAIAGVDARKKRKSTHRQRNTKR